MSVCHQEFIQNISQHVLTIEADQGVHRTLYLGRPGSSTYHYRIITWPGGLLIHGDMGSYSFQRVKDMFGFFRDADMEGKINPRYWHEKLTSEDKNSPAMEFSREKFEEAVMDHIQDWETTVGEMSKLVQEVKDEVIDGDPVSVDEAYALLYGFESSNGDRFFDFEANFRTYGFHFIWCLRAIVWAIKQYDLVKDERTQADHDRRVLAGQA